MASELKERDVKEMLLEADSLKKLAFFGVFISTVATLTAVVCVPMLYNYTQYIQASLQEELNFCVHRTSGLYNEFEKFETARRGKRDVGRSKFSIESGSPLETASWIPFGSVRRSRQGGYGASALAAGYNAAGVSSDNGGYGGYDAQPAHRPPSTTAPSSKASYDGHGDSNAETDVKHDNAASGSCCSCGVGPAGPAGPPGPDGNDGTDGHPGQDGPPGPDGSSTSQSVEPCFECEAAQPGPPGNPGPKGPEGIRGPPGSSSEVSAPGPAGPTGPPGPPGPAGQPGTPGERGQEGALSDVPGVAGPAGPEGPPGPPGSDGVPGTSGSSQPGPPGPPGDAGAPGSAGQSGEQGPRGQDGQNGPRGGCTHCPPPRTAPGY